MKILNALIDRMVQASWNRAQQGRQANEAPMRATMATLDEPSAHTLNRTFIITQALNGSYITFTRRKYNPNGPDDFRQEVYLVQPDESLIDAISTVLVLTEK
jgi:hypothetical protein